MQRLLLALVLGMGLTVRGTAQKNLPVSDTPDHVTSFGPDEMGLLSAPGLFLLAAYV